MDDNDEAKCSADAAVIKDKIGWEKPDALGEHLSRLTKIATSLRAEIEYVTSRKAQFNAAFPDLAPA